VKFDVASAAAASDGEGGEGKAVVDVAAVFVSIYRGRRLRGRLQCF
jgi:hypothetical protein